MTKECETHLGRSFHKNSPMLLAVVATSLFLIVFDTLCRMSESRGFRDKFGLTPFHSVQLHTTELVDEGLNASGELTKRRCTFDKLTGYVTFENHPKKRVLVIPSTNGGNRPASPDAEVWGPWLITYYDTPVPEGFEIFVHHVNCPSRPFEQDNLFISGEWKDYRNVELLGEID